MKKNVMLGAALIGLAVITGFSSCKKDDDDKECCSIKESAMGISTESSVCSDGSYYTKLNGETLAEGKETLEGPWSEYVEEMEEEGYSCD